MLLSYNGVFICLWMVGPMQVYRVWEMTNLLHNRYMACLLPRTTEYTLQKVPTTKGVAGFMWSSMTTMIMYVWDRKGEETSYALWYGVSKNISYEGSILR